jgi:hypothetical protein
MRKAFAYCGETDNAAIDERVDTELDTLMCLMAGSTPEVIVTDKGTVTGYVIDIAVTNGATNNEIVALRMVVGEDDINYVINSYTTTGDDFVIKNEHNRLVCLEEVNADIFS